MLTDFEKNFLKELIAIPSVGGDAAPGAPYGQVPREALDFFLKTAENEGFSTGVIDDKVGWLEFGDGEKLLGIVCHLDVVPVGTGWDTDPFVLTEKDGRVYGRGIVDDKGPAAAAFFAMRRIKETNPSLPFRVRLILGTDEERTCDCVETYAAKGEIPDFAITPDAEFPVIFAEKGILQIKVSGKGNGRIKASAGSAANMVPATATLEFAGKTYEASGVPAHASKPDLGVNAIFRLIESLDFDLKESPMLSFISDKFIGKNAAEYTGCDINDISGQITANPAILTVNEDTESLTIDIRYPVTADFEKIVGYINDEAGKYGLCAEVANHMPPICKDKDTSEIKTLTAIWEKHLDRYDGFSEEYRSMYGQPLAIGGGTYARHMPNTVAFGLQAPWQTDQCHQANESRSLSDISADIDILEETILKLGENL